MPFFIVNTLNTHILLPHMPEKLVQKSANVTYILPEVLVIKHSLKREEVKIRWLILSGCLYRVEKGLPKGELKL